MPNATCTPVTPTDGSFPIGEVAYWKILVLDVEQPRPAPTYEDLPAEQKSTAPSAVDLGLAPAPAAPAQKLEWKQTINAASCSSLATPDPDASSGAAVRCKPIGTPIVLAYMYCYPRIPGRYKATFRLKVEDNSADWVTAESPSPSGTTTRSKACRNRPATRGAYA